MKGSGINKQNNILSSDNANGVVLPLFSVIYHRVHEGDSDISYFDDLGSSQPQAI